MRDIKEYTLGQLGVFVRECVIEEKEDYRRSVMTVALGSHPTKELVKNLEQPVYTKKHKKGMDASQLAAFQSFLRELK